MRLLLLAAAGLPLLLLDAVPTAAQVVVYCTRPGYPVGCVANPRLRRALVRPVRPGGGLNAGGPVNRVGIR